MRPLVLYAAAAILLTFLLAMGTVLMVCVPVHPHDAAIHALEASEARSPLYEWECPGDGEIPPHRASLALDIPDEDIISGSWWGMLRQGAYGLGPWWLVDSDDPYVRAVAQHVAAETEGYSEYGRANAALRFVQGTISYSIDGDLYGVREFYARPADTLLLRQGDCEDTSILLCSVLSAMGYGCAIVTMPGHVAAAVELDGCPGKPMDIWGREFRYCETTGLHDVGDMLPEEEWEAHSPSERGILLEFANGFLAWYRTVLREVVGT